MSRKLISPSVAETDRKMDLRAKQNYISGKTKAVVNLPACHAVVVPTSSRCHALVVPLLSKDTLLSNQETERVAEGIFFKK